MSTVKIFQGQNELPVNTIVNQRTGLPMKIWVGTEAQYVDGVDTPQEDTIYIIQPNL